MKLFNHQTLGGLAVAAALFIIPSSSRADNTNVVSSVKPDLLKTCPISGDKLGGDMGEPFKFVYEGQEVKLCCSMCKAKFDKDPAKYIKKIEAAAVPKN
jgi:YHS domain-containing protein